jgi:hypothetical protein
LLMFPLLDDEFTTRENNTKYTMVCYGMKI